MNVWKYEIISRVEQDMSLIRFAHSWDILESTRHKFHISKHACIILYTVENVINLIQLTQILNAWNYVKIEPCNVSSDIT